MEEDYEVNPTSEFITWLIKFYCAHGISIIQAQERAMTLGLAIHKRLIEPISVYNQFFQIVQQEESQHAPVNHQSLL